jgi:hypothetical protein
MFVKNISLTLVFLFTFVLVSSAQNIRVIDNKGTLQIFNPWRLNGNGGTNPATNFIGTTDTAALRFRTNNIERLTIMGSGYVGIGTMNPVSRFSNSSVSVTGSDAKGSTTFTMINNNVGTWAGSFYTDVVGNGLNVKIKDNTANAIAFQVGSGNTSQQTSSGAAGSTSLFNVLGNGNIGIGTTTPSAQLEVASNNPLSTIIRRGGTTDLTPANLILQKTMGADAATQGAVTNGNFVGRILFSASNGSAYPLNGTDIVGYAAGNQSSTNNGGGIFFRTVPTNSTLQSVERMRIEHNGNIGIGTQTPTTNLDVVGGFSLRNVAAAAGTNFGIEFNTNASSPRIDWVYNGAYTGSFAGDADNFFRLQNSRVGSGGFRFNTNPSGTAIERLTILNNGNIGVNITNPNSRFEVSQASLFSGTESDIHAIQLSSGKTNSDFTLYMGADRTNGLSYLQSVRWSIGVAPLSLNARGGNVGVGVSNPISRFEVNGSATNTTAFNAGSATAITFNMSNLAYTSASAGTFNLQGMKDGGTYTLAVRGATSGTASFIGLNPSNQSFTFLSINNGPTVAGRHTLYTFIVMGTTVYFYMASGF